MMLIGAGGNGVGGTTGGGSGAVTVFYCAAQHVPDSLFVWVGLAQSHSYITIDAIGNIGYLTARAGVSQVAGPVTTAPSIAACGFYNSTAGQDGSNAGVGVSTTTFLSGGSAGTGVSVDANYGYGLTTASTNLNGTFLMQPIIVGVGGKGGAGIGGVGCGGGANGTGGPGMVLIASW